MLRPAMLVLLLPILGSCALLPLRTAFPARPAVIAATQVTTNARYISPAMVAGEDSPVLAAVVSLAPAAPHQPDRQPWQAEEIARNSVALRAHATISDDTTFESSIRTLPQEMSFNVISSGGVTTLTAVYSSAYAVTAQYIFDGVDKRFKRLP